jgi:excisionase family DNA binding protein
VNQLLRCQDVASILRCHVASVYRAVAEKRIPFLRVPGGVRFDPADLEVWIAAQKSQPSKFNK